MKIYFYTNLPAQNPDVAGALSYLKKVGAQVSSNLSESTEPMDRVDALIICGRTFDNKAGYLAALALAQRKSVLILLPKGAQVDETLTVMLADPNLAKRLRIMHYKGDLQPKLKDFVMGLDTSNLREFTNIKYTLRLSAKISDYLNWKADRIDIPKADWLRDAIKDMMEGDTEYKNFLNDKYRTDK